MKPANKFEEFLFQVFRDAARRNLWFVAGGDRFERFEECAALFTPDMRSLATAALATGDTRQLDDAVVRMLHNLHADFGYDTAKPQWWKGEEAGSKWQAKIRAVIERIEKLDPSLDRSAMQGTKADFFSLCKRVDPEFKYIVQSTFNDQLPGVCKFKHGARPSDYYRTLADKLG